MKKISLILVALFLIFGCSQQMKVNRVEADQQTDFSGRWNDTDSREVAKKVISEVLSSAWLENFTKENGEKPVVLVGNITTKESQEHIPVNTFIKAIEKELINSGKVKFIAGGKIRETLRSEKLEQQTNASMQTAKKLAAEIGADFMLFGSVSMISDAYKSKEARFYQVDLQLINIETNEIVWMESKEIKKIIERKSMKW